MAVHRSPIRESLFSNLEDASRLLRVPICHQKIPSVSPHVDTASAINCRHELDDPMPVVTVRLRYHASPQRPRVPATARVLILRAQVNMVTPAHDSCFPRPGCRQPLSRPTDEQGFLSRNDSNQSIFAAFVRLTGRVLSTGVTETVKSRESSSYTACIQHRP